MRDINYAFIFSLTQCKFPISTLNKSLFAPSWLPRQKTHSFDFFPHPSREKCFFSPRENEMSEIRLSLKNENNMTHRAAAKAEVSRSLI